MISGAFWSSEGVGRLCSDDLMIDDGPMFIDDTPDFRMVCVIYHDKWQNIFVCCRLGLVLQGVLSVCMPNLLYGCLINELLLTTPLVQLFREIFQSFLKNLIVSADASGVQCKTVCDILAAMRGWQLVGKRY